MTLQRLIVELGLDDARFTRGIRDATASAQRLGTGLQRATATGIRVFNSGLARLGSLATSATLAFGVLAAGVTALGAALKRGFLDPFAKQEKAVRSLATALAATGKGGAEALKLITDEATRLQRITTAGDEALIQASATIATLAPSLNVSALRDAETALVAIADTFLKGDLNSAAQVLGKTLGSTTNALTRYGISINDTAAPASAKMAEILGQLGPAFEVSKAQALTLEGGWTQLGNVAGDLREQIGEVIARTLGLDSQTRGLTTRIIEITENIAKNQDRWVAWGRVVTASVSLGVTLIRGLGTAAFETGQIIGRSLDIAAQSLIAFTTRDIAAFVRMGEQAQAIASDIESIRRAGERSDAAVEALVTAFEAVATAAGNTAAEVTTLSNLDLPDLDGFAGDAGAAADSTAKIVGEMERAFAATDAWVQLFPGFDAATAKVAILEGGLRKLIDDGLSPASILAQTLRANIEQIRDLSDITVTFGPIKGIGVAGDDLVGAFTGFTDRIEQSADTVDAFADSIEDGADALTGFRLFLDRIIGSIQGGASRLLDPALIVSNLATGAISSVVTTVLAGIFDKTDRLTEAQLAAIRAQEEWRRAIERNTETLERIRRAQFAPTFTAPFEEIIAALTEAEFFRGGIDVGFNFGAFEAALARVGLTMEDFRLVLELLGLEFDTSAAGVRNLIEALNFEVVDQEIARLKQTFDLLDFTPLEQFDALRDFLLTKLTGPLRDAVAALDAANLDEFIENLLTQLAADTFDFSQLEGIGLQQFLDVVGDLEHLGDSAATAADSLDKMTDELLNVPSGFKTALEIFRATIVEELTPFLPPGPLRPPGGGGQGTGPFPPFGAPSPPVTSTGVPGSFAGAGGGAPLIQVQSVSVSGVQDLDGLYRELSTVATRSAARGGAAVIPVGG